jgi:prepilin-type N-terminal cleavage/methylation domain-containing protein
MSAASPPERRDAGFTLAETLVSLVILTLGLVALIEIFGNGFRGVRASELDAAALHLATSQLTRAGAETPLRRGQQQGTTPDGLEWSVTIEPYTAPRSEQETRPTVGLEAYWVTSEVRWRSSVFAAAQSLSLTTLKLTVP